MSTFSLRVVGRGARWGLIFSITILALPVLSSVASARDINLGGLRTEKLHSQAENELKAQLPKSAVELPRMVASVLNHETGRWKRVLIDAYIEPADSHTLNQIKDHLKDIVARTRPHLQATPAENLEAARNGPREARNCIRLAAEQSLGRSWQGDVFIRSLAVF